MEDNAVCAMLLNLWFGSEIERTRPSRFSSIHESGSVFTSLKTGHLCPKSVRRLGVQSN